MLTVTRLYKKGNQTGPRLSFKAELWDRASPKGKAPPPSVSVCMLGTETGGKHDVQDVGTKSGNSCYS